MKERQENIEIRRVLYKQEKWKRADIFKEASCSRAYIPS